MAEVRGAGLGASPYYYGKCMTCPGDGADHTLQM